MESLRKYSEWDSEETVDSIVDALEETGNEVLRIPADKGAFIRLRNLRHKLDVVFNIAEGLSSELLDGVMRESSVPAFMEFLQIPYTGSGPLTLAEALDKSRTKQIAGFNGVRTAKFQLITRLPFELRKDMGFPLVVKPSAEGSSIGLTQKSKVDDEESLREAVRVLIEDFRQPALVEEYIGGREYTVGMVGKSVMPVMMIDLSKMPDRPFLRDQAVKDMEPQYVWTNNRDPALSLAPFDSFYVSLVRSAVMAHEALRCRDYNRLDLREKDCKPYLLEMNPLPGLHPSDGDLPVMAKAAGIDHCTLINSVLLESIFRYRSDSRFTDRFRPDRIVKISDKVESAMERVRYYPRDLETSEGSYRLLRAAHGVE